MCYRSFSDADLFALLGNGDHLAFTQIYERYSGKLYVHVYNRIRNREEARDVIHELFAALWNKKDQIVLRTELSAYLYTAARNRLIDLVNRKKIHTDYTSTLSSFVVSKTNITDHQVREKELEKLIEKEINALPEKMREVFNLSRKKHMSHREIADVLQISEFTVRKQINNALKVLRPKLGKLMNLIFL